MNRIINTQMSRRKFLRRAAELGLAAGAVGLGVGAILERIPRSPWDPKAFPRRVARPWRSCVRPATQGTWSRPSWRVCAW